MRKLTLRLHYTSPTPDQQWGLCPTQGMASDVVKTRNGPPRGGNELDLGLPLRYKAWMQEDWAAEHLQVIRTLMERAAVYRRALAPLMTFAGLAGLVAAAIGWNGHLDSPAGFVGFWAAVSIVAVAGALIMVRRQALKEGEPVWSPPMRRIAQAMVPCLFLGAIAGVFAWLHGGTEILPPLWAALYGCALHAAGFFMQRGIRLFGGCFVAAGGALLILTALGKATWSPHLMMGFFFGALHLAYGIYLYFTEQRRNPA